MRWERIVSHAQFLASSVLQYVFAPFKRAKGRSSSDSAFDQNIKIATLKVAAIAAIATWLSAVSNVANVVKPNPIDPSVDAIRSLGRSIDKFAEIVAASITYVTTQQMLNARDPVSKGNEQVAHRPDVIHPATARSANTSKSDVLNVRSAPALPAVSVQHLAKNEMPATASTQPADAPVQAKPKKAGTVTIRVLPRATHGDAAAADMVRAILQAAKYTVTSDPSADIQIIVTLNSPPPDRYLDSQSDRFRASAIGEIRLTATWADGSAHRELSAHVLTKLENLSPIDVVSDDAVRERILSQSHDKLAKLIPPAQFRDVTQQ